MEDSSLTGYPLEIFSLPPKEALICVACRGVIRLPLQTVCGHRICQKCYETRLLQMSDRASDGIPCPDCKTLLLGEDVFHDKFAEREVNSLVTTCPFAGSGCPWKGDIKQREMHIVSCGFKPVHDVEPDGLDFEIACNDTDVIPIRLMNKISSGGSCPFKLIAGCTFEGEADAMQDHLERTMVNHVEKLMSSMLGMRRKQIELNKAFKEDFENRKQIADLLEKVSHQETLIGTLQDEVANVKRERDQMKEIISRLEDGSLPSPMTIMRLEEELKEMRLFVTKFDQTKRPMLTDEDDDISNANRLKMNKMLTKLESEAAQQDVTLANLNLRLCLLQSTTYDGVLMWRIDQLQSRMEDAAKGKVPSLFSPPFYTHRFGYRLCARIYLNGDGVGKASHVSLFIVVMKGEYDDILPWPLRRKVVFTLIDQKNTGNDLVKSFNSDPNSSSFKQPEKDMNIASGCPYFLERKALLDKDTRVVKTERIRQDSPYVSNNSIMVKVAVA